MTEKKRLEMKRSKRREGFLALALISPYLVVFLLFTLIPFLLGFVFSFMRYNPYTPEENSFYGFNNYINIFNFDLPISSRSGNRLPPCSCSTSWRCLA